MARVSVWCAVAALVYVVSSADAVRPVANPMTHPAECGRPHTSWLCDPAKLLSAEDASQVESALARVRDEAPVLACGKGYQFGMAIVPTLELYGTRPTEEGARALAKATHDAWGVGHSECQSGMMLVLALDDRKLYLSTGRDAREVVTDDSVQNIIARMKPLLKANDPAAAMVLMADHVQLVASGKPLPEVESDFSGLPVLILFLGCVFGPLAWNCRKRRRFTRVRNRLERISALRTQLEERTRRLESRNATTTDTPAGDSAAVRHRTGGAGDTRGDDGGDGATPTSSPRVNADADAENGSVLYETDHCPVCLEDFPQRSVSAGAGGGAGAGAAHHHGVATLSCGHQLCTNCALKWLKDHNVCPICRQPQRGAGEGGNGKSVPAEAGSTYQRDPQRMDRLLLEYELLRVHTMYPDVVTRQQVRSWQSPAFRGSYHTDPTFQRSYDAVFSSGSSSSGSSSSWGGGGSFGGGGGGGSW